MAWLDNASVRLVPSDLMDARFSNQRGGPDVLNGILLFNFYEVYTDMENSKDWLALSSGDITYLREYQLFKTGFKSI